ncbi:LIM domain and actin-binding protein 1 [Branchiostoma belcheri]|nr:LIM domain and actin-binding protein 1 [Branchiostoma belcheri]
MKFAMGDTEVLADVTNTDVAMNGDNEVFEDSKVFTQKTSITLKKSNASSSSARSGSLSGDEDKKGMKRVSRSSRTSSSSYEKKKREPARLAPSAFAKFQQADAMSSSAPAKKINIKLSRSVRDRASETDTTMSTVKQIQDSSDKCKTCGKRVYPVEKLVADKNVYHNTCFKCAECNRTLRVGTYASIDGAIYCKPHFQQLFKLKGNYDEGFGKERAVKKWSAAQGDIPPDGLLKTEAQEPAKKQRRGRDGDAVVTPDSGVDVESPSSQKNSRKSSRSKSFSDDDEEEGRKGSTSKPSEIPQQLLSVKERMAMYQSEISSTGEARKSTSGDDRKTVATGTLADLRKRWESGDLLTYQEKESTSGTTTGDEMEDTVVKSTSHSHKAIIRQEETIVAQEIKAARSKFESFNDDNDQKPRRMKTSSSDHDMNGVVNNGRSSPYRDEEFGQSNYESGRRSSTGDVEVVKSTTPTADDRELVKAGTASNLKKRWESGDLQDYRERSGSSSSSSSESAHDAEEEPVIIVASRSAEETKSAAPKLQPTQKEVPQPERREMRKSESVKKRYEEKLEKKEAKDEEREEAPRRALNRAPSFSRTMAAKFEKGAVRSRSSSSSSSSQDQDPDAEIVRATSHYHKEKPDKVVNLGLSARLRSMFEKGDVHNVEAPARKSPVAIPRSTSTPDISKAGRRDSTSSSSSEEGEAHAVKTSFSDDEVEHRKADIKGPSAKSLRAMFETNKTEDSGPTTLPKAKPKSISLFKTPPMEKCRACGKTVYAMEKIATDHDTFHKSCFKCDYCKKVLSLGTFAGIHDKLYCKPHFKQLFQAKGNYDEGFGHLQRKSKWAPKSDGPAEDTQERRQIEEAEEVKRPVPTRRPRSADLEDFDDKPPVEDDQDDEEFEGPKRRSHSASSGEGSKHRSHSASSGEGRQGRSHSASSEERRTKRRSGSSSSMDEEERRQRELSLKMGSAEEEIKRARLYRQKLLREDSQDEEDC